MEKQVTGYSFQGGNSENSQSQMDCIPTFELLQHLQDIIQRRSAFTEHEICTPLKKPRTLNQVPEIPFINSITPLDQATDIQTDDSPKTECLQSWSTLKTKMPRTSQILSDLKLAIDSS
ncbi:hypothetical protein CDAR_591871 [Caerostris darwini]|uniref:Uncharacterized protein n=1 Tax=Caerostris darwini TaxID=1538125 RepID=A0AAV4WXQ6_9ARAC|nr:hypothetical protein CDAR_591871 [Caerostris darwini]